MISTCQPSQTTINETERPTSVNMKTSISEKPIGCISPLSEPSTCQKALHLGGKHGNFQRESFCPENKHTLSIDESLQQERRKMLQALQIAFAPRSKAQTENPDVKMECIDNTYECVQVWDYNNNESEFDFNNNTSNIRADHYMKQETVDCVSDFVHYPKPDEDNGSVNLRVDIENSSKNVSKPECITSDKQGRSENAIVGVGVGVCCCCESRCSNCELHNNGCRKWLNNFVFDVAKDTPFFTKRCKRRSKFCKISLKQKNIKKIKCARTTEDQDQETSKPEHKDANKSQIKISPDNNNNNESANPTSPCDNKDSKPVRKRESEDKSEEQPNQESVCKKQRSSRRANWMSQSVIKGDFVFY